MPWPSGDQPTGTASRSSPSAAARAPTPDAVLTYIRVFWPSFDAYATRVPSGDHDGVQSFPASNVSRDNTARPRSITQTSRLLLTHASTAALSPEGDSSTAPYSPASPTVPIVLPERSYHVSWRPTD